MLALLLPVLAALPIGPAADAQLPPGATVDRVSQAVVRVEARGCPGGDRVGSGFLWPRADSVVTAMHVVAGCQRLAVYYEQRRIGRDARLARVLREADLAQITVTDAPEIAALAHDVGEPALNEDLMALGFFLGAPTMSSKALKMAYGSAVLRDMLPDSVQREIQSAGVPSLGLNILRLDGHLLHGLSGAPIINRDGRVVAVGDGGLENGAAAVSWALPARNLERLLQSADAITGDFRATSVAFSASLQSQPGASLRCGGVDFTKMRTRPFEQLAQSTDDPLGLQQLLASAPNVDLTGVQYDIYSSIDSGATIAIPAGATLATQSGRCVARAPSGKAELHVRGDEVADFAALQRVSESFETEVGGQPELLWQIDPLWSYLLPQPRFDGFVVNRKTFNGFNRLTGQPAAAAFETLMTRGTVFAGIAVLNFGVEPQLELGCPFAPQLPACVRYQSLKREWAALVIGVFLSTFPIG